MNVGPLIESDRPRWTELWRHYLDFYQTSLPETIYDHTWTRLMEDRELHGLAARDGDTIVGITHFLYHPSCWTLTPYCYLQDLFTDAAHRNRGVAKSLIAAVAQHATAAGSTRLYWMTQVHNNTARALYEKLARHNGFIRYDVSLPA